MVPDSRRKGNAYESRIVEMIRTAYELERPDVYRTPQSGGHRADSVHNPGDIQFAPWLRPALPLVIECKHHRTASLSTLLGPTPGQLWSGWLGQALRQVRTDKQIPCLVARVDRIDLALLPGTARITGAVYPLLRIRYHGSVWHGVRFQDLLPKYAEAVRALRRKRGQKAT